MPEKTKGQGFSELITRKLDAGLLEILLQVEVTEQGNTTVTVFKGLKKDEPDVKGGTVGDTIKATAYSMGK